MLLTDELGKSSGSQAGGQGLGLFLGEILLGKKVAHREMIAEIGGEAEKKIPAVPCEAPNFRTCLPGGWLAVCFLTPSQGPAIYKPTQRPNLNSLALKFRSITSRAGKSISKAMITLIAR